MPELPSANRSVRLIDGKKYGCMDSDGENCHSTLEGIPNRWTTLLPYRRTNALAASVRDSLSSPRTSGCNVTSFWPLLDQEEQHTPLPRACSLGSREEKSVMRRWAGTPHEQLVVDLRRRRACVMHFGQSQIADVSLALFGRSEQQLSPCLLSWIAR
jgi:hypothetical protein